LAFDSGFEIDRGTELDGMETRMNRISQSHDVRGKKSSRSRFFTDSLGEQQRDWFGAFHSLYYFHFGRKLETIADVVGF
jgi:hypothetical protein